MAVQSFEKHGLVHGSKDNAHGRKKNEGDISGIEKLGTKKSLPGVSRTPDLKITIKFTVSRLSQLGHREDSDWSAKKSLQLVHTAGFLSVNSLYVALGVAGKTNTQMKPAILRFNFRL